MTYGSLLHEKAEKHILPYYENLSRVKNGAKKHPLHNPLLKTYERYVAV